MSSFQQLETDLRHVVGLIVEPRVVTNVRGDQAVTLPLVEEVFTSTSQIRTDTPSSPSFRSKPPLWLPAVDWSNEVRGLCMSTARYFGRGADLLGVVRGLGDDGCAAAGEALRWTLGLPWAPEHVDVLEGFVRSLKQCFNAGIAIVYPPRFTVSAACPECGALKGSRVDGETVKTVPALSVHDMWAQCSACGARWEQGDIAVLAELLRGGV